MDEAGRYVIKVDDEEIDHADSMTEARGARDAIIYGEIGTEVNTTIEIRGAKEAEREGQQEQG